MSSRPRRENRSPRLRPADHGRVVAGRRRGPGPLVAGSGPRPRRCGPSCAKARPARTQRDDHLRHGAVNPLFRCASPSPGTQSVALPRLVTSTRTASDRDGQRFSLVLRRRTATRRPGSSRAVMFSKLLHGNTASSIATIAAWSRALRPRPVAGHAAHGPRWQRLLSAREERARGRAHRSGAGGRRAGAGDDSRSLELCIPSAGRDLAALCLRRRGAAGPGDSAHEHGVLFEWRPPERSARGPDRDRPAHRAAHQRQMAQPGPGQTAVVGYGMRYESTVPTGRPQLPNRRPRSPR